MNQSVTINNEPDVFIKATDVPAFSIDDPEAVPVSSLRAGDRFRAQFTGDFELHGTGSGMVQAVSLTTGKIIDFGPFALVKRVI